MLERLELLGDPLRLQQVLLNLVSNAIKFTEPGCVTVAIHVDKQSGNDVLLRFEIHDTGIGMSAETLARIFTPFEQADGSMTRKYGGAGLGLTICQRLIHLMGGHISVDSDVGIGSTFTFTLSCKTANTRSHLVESSTQISGHAAEEYLRSEFADAHILVAEDDWLNQEVIIELLRDSVGFQVDLAQDGAMAVEMAQKNGYSLILMDMQMPVMNGVQATHRIRQIQGIQGIPIIAMTANAFSEDKIHCLEVGMDDFITKPVDPDMLFVTILKWLESRKAKSPISGSCV
ncbi:MAG: Response regulator [Proteobacteria bacterium]|nr:Response regulator [Pseudomonadota bacterium]